MRFQLCLDHKASGGVVAWGAAASAEGEGPARPWRQGNMPSFYHVSAVDMAITHSSASFVIEFDQPEFGRPKDRTKVALTQAKNLPSAMLLPWPRWTLGNLEMQACVAEGQIDVVRSSTSAWQQHRRSSAAYSWTLNDTFKPSCRVSVEGHQCSSISSDKQAYKETPNIFNGCMCYSSPFSSPVCKQSVRYRRAEIRMHHSR